MSSERAINLYEELRCVSHLDEMDIHSARDAFEAPHERARNLRIFASIRNGPGQAHVDRGRSPKIQDLRRNVCRQKEECRARESVPEVMAQCTNVLGGRPVPRRERNQHLAVRAGDH